MEGNAELEEQPPVEHGTELVKVGDLTSTARMTDVKMGRKRGHVVPFVLYSTARSHFCFEVTSRDELRASGFGCNRRRRGIVI